MANTPPVQFRFQAKKVHATYATHIDMAAVKEMYERLGKLEVWSIVHEVGDEDEDNPTPYEHTHVFAWWKEKVSARDSRFLDWNGIHPNIKSWKSILWAKTICLRYHHGHKTKKDGRKYFIAPIKLEQEGVDEWKLNGDLWDAVAAAPTLKDACEFAGVVPKSISDINAIRNAKVKRSFAQVEEDCTDEWIEAPKAWDRKKKALVLEGVANTGKTNWAKAQFKCPHEITDIECLKNIPDGCDGLVFDDQEYATMKMTTQKMIADVRKGTTIRTRHHNAFKPHLPAIFTTNNRYKLFNWHDDQGAMDARCFIWERGTSPMYIKK